MKSKFSNSDWYVTIFLVLLASQLYSQKNKNITKKQLQGGWVLVDGVDIIKTADADENPYSGTSHLLFEGDTLYFIDYPCQVRLVVRFETTTKSITKLPLHTNTSGKPLKVQWSSEWLPYTASFKFDTLQLSQELGPGHTSKSTYVRFTFYHNTLSKLKKHKTNSDCSEGKWKLIRNDGDGYGADWVYDYPTGLLDSLVISKADIKAPMFKGSTIMLPVNGKNKPCKIEFYTHHGSGGWGFRMRLKPLGWCKDKTLRIHYQRFWKMEHILNVYFIGDINHDGKADSSYVNYDRIIGRNDIIEKECANKNCEVTVKFGSNIPDLVIDQSLSIYVQKTDDLNSDSANEIILFSENLGYWHDLSVWTLKDNTWKQIARTKVMLNENKDYEERIVKTDSQYYLVGDGENPKVGLIPRSIKVKIAK